MQTNERVEKCWEAEIDWKLYPSALKKGNVYNVCKLHAGHVCFMCNCRVYSKLDQHWMFLHQ